MDTSVDLFLRGLFLGLAVAVPLGPISLICIHRTLADGRLTGITSGIGVATADALYAAVASLSLGFISLLILRYQFWSTMLGSLAICLIGLNIFFSKVPLAGHSVDKKNVLDAYISAFLLALANPGTVLFFLAAFSGLGVASINGSEFGTYLVATGTFLGSSMWWLALCTGTGLLRDRVTSRLHLFNRIAGAMIFLTGLYAARDFLM